MKALTPATREMRITPSEDETRAAEEPGFRPTVFVCRPMKQRERMVSWDEQQQVEVRPDGTRLVVSRRFQQAREILLACVTAVEEFPEGAPEAYPAHGTLEQKEAFLARVPDLVLDEVAYTLRERSAAGEPAGN